ncbi:MAG: hypothetical protein IKS90_07505 [Clostridia bacterium]|nr:hypothetical protein [Clostridia bacterium]
MGQYSSMIAKYRFADVNVLIKTDFEFELINKFDEFRYEFGKPDLTYEYYMQNGFETPDYPPIYTDSFCRVYRKDGITYRYFTAMPDNQYNALITDEAASDGVFKVYLQGLQEPVYFTELRLFNYFAVEHAMALFGGVLLHSSYIIHNGEAILFSAPSGTGKSTQADLWHKHMGSLIVNGDRSLLKIENGAIKVHCLPYCGSSNISNNITAPLKTIVILRQAPYNKITRLRPAEAFKHIYSECSADIWYENDVRVIGDIIETAINTVPVYKLECLPDKDAVHTLAGALGIECK